MADLLDVFDDVDEQFRMVCVDSVFVGCYLYRMGKKKAGEKLIKTSLLAAGINDNELIADIFADIDESLNTVKAHSELRGLIGP